MTSPALAVDVDGVLNPYKAKPHCRPEGYQAHRLRPTGWVGKPLRVWLHPEHGPMLLDLAERADVELWWCTTWEYDANTMIGPPIGLPALPVVEFGFRAARWKFGPVLEAFAGRPLAWLDDDFYDFADALLPWFLQQRGDTPTLLVTIDPAVGLRQCDLDSVADWSRGLDRG